MNSVLVNAPQLSSKNTMYLGNINMNHSVCIAINNSWCLQFSVCHLLHLEELGQGPAGLKAVSE